MLLRSDAHVALNRIAELCTEAAEHYSSTATRCGDRELAKMFNSLAASHNQMAAELMEHLRCMGGLPETPDPDREAVGELIRRLKELFSGDTWKTVLEDHLRMEMRLMDAVHEASAKCHRVATGRFLHKAGAIALASQERLATVGRMTNVPSHRSD